jgi:hypothetical protein
MWQEMRDSAKWEYDAAQSSEDRKTNLAIAALGNESASDANKARIIRDLGGFAIDLWKKI